MKITYNEYLPLDGAGTLLHPAYKWRVDERTEFCDNLMKAGNLWYMMRGGYVHHSIDVEKITQIETKTIKASCSYKRGEKFPFCASINNNVGNHIGNVGSVHFDTIIETILKQ